MGGQESRLYEILRTWDELNRRALRLTGSEKNLFDRPSLQLPRFEPPELGFLRCVSWLYVVIFEVAKPSVGFLEALFGVYSVDVDGSRGLYRPVLSSLRTYEQHNLEPRKRHDRDVKDRSEAWYSRACGTAVPFSADEWRCCTDRLLEETRNYAGGLLGVLRAMEQDESGEEMILQWRFRLDRHFSANEFMPLIEEISADMGREHVDARRLLDRFYDAWMKELRLLMGEFDFRVEARKLIEHTLLNETVPVLPITGHDLIREFALEPGRLIGDLLKEARVIYEAAPCSASDLLERIRPLVGRTSDS